MNVLKLIGRQNLMFDVDLSFHYKQLVDEICSSSFLVIGGAGTIGQSVSKELFKRSPRKLHVVDINENNLVELVRDIRSTLGYSKGDFRTYAIDCGGNDFVHFMQSEGPYDYIFNLSALKHVRSEKDPFTLMRMIDVNIFNTINTLTTGRKLNAKKYFCVSTDKAANPVNMMGASKRIMEMFLMRESVNQAISMARFANVAFSDGSLLHGFNQRFAKKQPITAPCDVRRYFVTPQESGELCLFSGILGDNRDIFFPKLSENLHLITFSEIATKYLVNLGYEPFECDSEEEARLRSKELISSKRWPCYFFKSDTTGEKDFEEFFTKSETLDMNRFNSIGIIKNELFYDENLLDHFANSIARLKNQGAWSKSQLVELFHLLLPDFNHMETGKYLDQRM